ncbi:hypothetical protein DKX38_026677 [Salix brachista]|uniref:MATH domain-containing protein n=1 Tax=Salix brachista TaxID=2182728 RepID=A0A5N5JA42_9ROSI|nr:hypothetical protein DKX38_026677 [Salix brachista]
MKKKLTEEEKEAMEKEWSTSTTPVATRASNTGISFDFPSIFPCDNALTAAGDNSTQLAIISTNHTQTPQSAPNPQQPHHTSSITPYSPTSTDALASSSSPLQPNQDPPVNPSPSISTAIPELPPPTHHMVTRSRTGSLRSKEFPDFQLFYASKHPLHAYTGVLNCVEPTNFSQAVLSQDWKQAMQLEFNALMLNNTWELEFALKTLGSLGYFLGIEASRDTHGLHLRQNTARKERHVAPAHYSMKIDSFSLLSEMVDNSLRILKLVLYPNGDKSRNVEGYISLYLVMADTTGFPPGWEINAIIKFFVFDQLQDKYLTIGDGSLRRFSAIKNKWGLSQMLSLSIFNNASNGYLIGDSCVFGVEVFVIKNEGKGEHFSMIKDPSGGTFTWEVQKFSELTAEFYYSPVYLAGRHQWKLKLFPNGNTQPRGKHLSLFLELRDCTKFHAGWKLFVEFTLRIRDQVCWSHHHEETLRKWFDASENDWGLTSFISLTDIKNQLNNFVVNDTLIVEGVLNCLSVLKDFDGASLIRKD